MIRRILAFSVAVIILAAATGCGKKEEKAVAVVNGVDIKTADYERTLDMLKAELEQQDVDLNSEEGKAQAKGLEEQAIDQLVTTEVLLQQANKKGYTVSEEDVDEEIGKMREQYGEQFKEMLEMNQMTEESLEKLIRENKLIMAYMDGALGEITVTDEEMKKYYDDYSQQSEEEIPEYDEVEDQIEKFVKSEKEYEKTTALINELKDNSEITILIE
jgi:hypothetical protein